MYVAYSMLIDFSSFRAFMLWLSVGKGSTTRKRQSPIITAVFMLAITEKTIRLKNLLYEHHWICVASHNGIHNSYSLIFI